MLDTSQYTQCNLHIEIKYTPWNTVSAKIQKYKQAKTLVLNLEHKRYIAMKNFKKSGKSQNSPVLSGKEILVNVTGSLTFISSTQS